MKPTIHPQASENYNTKIKNLANNLTSEHRLLAKLGQQAVPNPNLPISFTFDESNIFGELKPHWRDKSGKMAARAFSKDGVYFGLFDDKYEDLIRIAENYQKSIIPKGVVSVEFLEETLFDWIKLYDRKETNLEASDFVLNECEKQINVYEVWMPISYLHIQSSFKLGKVKFRTVTKQIMNLWERSIRSRTTKPAEIEGIDVYFKKNRKEIQGAAMATIRVEAEPIRAHEIALEETEKAMTALRFFSPVSFNPTQVCYCAPWGKQHLDSDRYLLVAEGRIVSHISGNSDKTNVLWNLSDEEFEIYRHPGLDLFHFLFNKENLTDFQEKYLEAVSIYSRSLLNKQISDRLIYTLVALETIFLKDSGEFIQEAISLRMAYMQPVSVEDRRKIIKNVKDTYALRSSFIHHGQSVSVDNLATLKEFMKNAWLSLHSLIPFAFTEITKEGFFTKLEDRKISG